MYVCVCVRAYFLPLHHSAKQKTKISRERRKVWEFTSVVKLLASLNMINISIKKRDVGKSENTLKI